VKNELEPDVELTEPPVGDVVIVTTPFPVVRFSTVTLPSTIVMEPNAELLSLPLDDEEADTDELPDPVTEDEIRTELEAALATPGRASAPPIARVVIPRTARADFAARGRVAFRTLFIFILLRMRVFGFEVRPECIGYAASPYGRQHERNMKLALIYDVVSHSAQRTIHALHNAYNTMRNVKEEAFWRLRLRCKIDANKR
jgi:hypothetical protein